MLAILFSLLFLILGDSFGLNTYTTFIILAVYLIYLRIYIYEIKHISYVIPIKFNIGITLFRLTVFLKSLFKYCRNCNLFRKKKTKWKPIFKKSSYFGLYRANKNQWLNK